MYNIDPWKEVDSLRWPYNDCSLANRELEKKFNEIAMKYDDNFKITGYVMHHYPCYEKIKRQDYEKNQKQEEYWEVVINIYEYDERPCHISLWY